MSRLITDFIIWLFPRVGKMKQILGSVWLPESPRGQDRPIVATRDFPRWSRKNIFWAIL